ncbi:MAG: NAD-dependent epimerase/dehydratase family protein [Deltaproteobacteria bacterium]|nr:NAD-dependent epimerase/dehydratase family protein [Deltaproteobacteria bacterium]
MNCCVLGGAGFIGSHVVDGLVERGHRVRVFDLPNVHTDNLSGVLSGIECVSGDFHNRTDLARILDGMDVIVHLIGTTVPGPSNENPAYDVESNVIGTLNLLDEARRAAVKRIVFASSGGTVYGVPMSLPVAEDAPTNPICSYGITKLAIEKYLALYRRLYGLDYTVLRLANPYGERQRTRAAQGAVAVFLGKVARGEPIVIWGDGSVARDYFYIGDLVPAFMSAVEKKSPSRIYNIGGGVARSLNDIVALIGEVTERQPVVCYEEGRSLDVPVNCLDISRAGNELGWSPKTEFREGLNRTWAWIKENID